MDDPCTDDTGAGTPPIVDIGAFESTARPPAAPRGVQATDGDYFDRVAVSWLASDSCSEYQVYRNIDPDPNAAELIGDWQSEVEFDDATATPGQVYWYWIIARNSLGESGFSAAESGFRYPEQPPAAPTGLALRVSRPSGRHMAGDALRRRVCGVAR